MVRFVKELVALGGVGLAPGVIKSGWEIRWARPVLLQRQRRAIPQPRPAAWVTTAS